MPSETVLAHAIADTATPLAGAPTDFDLLLDRVGDARFVLARAASAGKVPAKDVASTLAAVSAPRSARGRGVSDYEARRFSM